MRYHYEKPNEFKVQHAEIYLCDHPVYNRCTLFRKGDRGLAVIQQRFVPHTKSTRWNEIDPWLIEELYSHPKFWEYFDQKATPPDSFLFPTVTIRQIMWALRMKPMPKKVWETVFDRNPI